MPRANFGGQVDLSALFADLYRADTAKAEQAVDDAQDAADSDAYDRWQNELSSDEEWLTYISARLAATAGKPKEHQRWVELQRQVFTVQKQKGEKKAKELKAAEAARQRATDLDMQSQWEQGLLSNDEWLEYIASRVAGTANSEDPQEHQSWVETQREYVRHIEDTSMAAKYESGEISAGQYIAYKQRVLAGLDAGSSKAQEMRAEITKLVDAALQNDIVSRSQEITDGIKNQTHTLGDLLALYKEAQKTARPGSELAKTLVGEISKVEGEIKSQARNGALERIEYLFKANKITGKEAGRQIRAVAEQYDKGDDATYYNTLEAALGFEKYLGLLSAGTAAEASRGGGGRRRSGGGGGSTAPSKNLLDAHDAQITRAITVTDQFLNNNRGEPGMIFDPATGKEVWMGTKEVRAIQLAANESYEGKYELYEEAYKRTGKTYYAEQAAKTAQKQNDFIQKAVQPVNTLGPAEQTANFVNSLNRTIVNTARASNDPLDVLRAADEAANKIDAYVGRLTTTTKTTQNPTSEDMLMAQGARTSTTKSKAPESQPMPELIRELQATSAALRAVAAGGDPKIIGAELQRGTGSFVPDGLFGDSIDAVAGANHAYAGLASGTHVLAQTDKGISVVPLRDKTVVIPGQGAEAAGFGTRKVPDIELGDGEEWETVFMDVNGAPTAVWAVSVPVPSNFKAWQATTNVDLVGPDGQLWKFGKGSWIPSSFIGKSAAPGGTKDNPVEGMSWKDYVAIGAVVSAAVDLGWRAIQTPEYSDNGKTYGAKVWVQDRTTGKWYLGKPPVSADTAQDGTIRLSDDYAPSVIYRPHGDAAGVRAPYVGSNPKVMQAVADQYGLDTGGTQIIDSLGVPRPAPPDYVWTDYFDPELEARVRAARASIPEGEDNFWYTGPAANARVEKAKDISAAVFRDERRKAKLPSEDQLPFMARFAETAKGYGITMTAPKAPTPQEVHRAPTPVPMPVAGGVVKQAVPTPISIRPAPAAAGPVGGDIAPGIPLPKPPTTKTAAISAPAPLSMNQRTPGAAPKAPTPQEAHRSPAPAEKQAPRKAEVPAKITPKPEVKPAPNSNRRVAY